MQSELVKYLVKALAEDLPGMKAHQKMVPPGRKLIPSERDMVLVKHSGVLFLLFPENGSLKTCLIKRPKNMTHHPGQIGFPGGKVEQTDLSFEKAAMREAEEEVGLSPDSYSIIGKLSDLYIHVSNFIIHPYLAWANQKPQFRINPMEVEKIISFPVQDLMENEQVAETELETSSGILKVLYYPYDGEIVWGATAMILSEFLELTKCYQLLPE